MKLFTRFGVIVLALLLLLVSCGSGGQTDTNKTTNPKSAFQIETVPAETESEFIADALPEKLDFNGLTFTTLYATM